MHIKCGQESQAWYIHVNLNTRCSIFLVSREKTQKPVLSSCDLFGKAKCPINYFQAGKS